MNGELSYTFEAKDGGKIRVEVEPSLTHPTSCRFIVDPPVYPEGSVHFAGQDKAQGSPLAEALFELEGVDQVLIGGAIVTLTTTEPADWGALAPRTAEIIRDQLNSGTAPVSQEITDNLPTAESIRDQAQQVLDTAINPAVSQHGGFVRLLDVQGNDIYLEFGGGCQGCGMVNVTLKYGVERLMRERIPDMGQIFDTTDHASGRNPYYAPASK